MTNSAANVRRVDIEVLRILSCLGIVYFHSGMLTGVANSLAYSGLAFFIFLSVYFVNKATTVPEAFRKIAAKVVPSFMFWSIVYIALSVAIAGKALESYLGVQTLLTGGSIHLWYLPFIIIGVTASVYIVHTVKPKLLFWIVAAGYFGWLGTSLYWRDWIRDYPLPAPQYFHALGAVLLALFVRAGSGVLRYSALLLSLLLCGHVASQGELGIGVVYFMVTLMSVLVVWGKDLYAGFFPFRKWVVSFSTLTFGIYLVHPLFIAIAVRLGVSDWYTMPLLAFLGSAVFVRFFLWAMPPYMHRLVRV
ncbi:acyltransferase family protein [Thalassolituus sp.]|uniref:acyltransferase family protein n=1 Tax=Thalassolituus sp. TaxID=2030822 RepID=UPI0035176FF9